MIRPTQPLQQYDYNNESQFRTQVQQADLLNVKRDEAVAYIIMTDDDGTPGYLKIVGGIPTWEAIIV